MASGSTTVGALPYPVSTDAPSVHTDIQALAQALANRLMSPTAHSTSATLSDGELAVSTAAPITLALPSATANAKVGVFAKVATATNPVTISSGSSNIYGLGLNGVSSLVLGTIGSFVILQSDGANWFVVAGQQDTGWFVVAVTPAGTPNNEAPAVRQRGDRLSFKGDWICSGSAFSFLTLPSGVTPPSHSRQGLVPYMKNATGVWTATYAELGATVLSGTSLAAGDKFALDGLDFPL